MTLPSFSPHNSAILAFNAKPGMRYKQRDRTQDLKVQKQMCAEGFEGNDYLKVTRAALNRMMCVLYCTYFDGYDKDNHL